MEYSEQLEMKQNSTKSLLRSFYKEMQKINNSANVPLKWIKEGWVNNWMTG